MPTFRCASGSNRKSPSASGNVVRLPRRTTTSPALSAVVRSRPVMRLPRRLTARRLMSNRSNNRACERRPIDEFGLRRNDGLHHADVIGRCVFGVLGMVPRELQARTVHHLFESGRLALEDQNVTGLQGHRAAGRILALPPVRSSVTTSISFSPKFSRSLIFFPTTACLLGHHDFGRIALQIEGGVDRRRALSPGGQKPPAESEKKRALQARCRYPPM